MEKIKVKVYTFRWVSSIFYGVEYVQTKVHFDMDFKALAGMLQTAAVYNIYVSFLKVQYQVHVQNYLGIQWVFMDKTATFTCVSVCSCNHSKADLMNALLVFLCMFSTFWYAYVCI